MKNNENSITNGNRIETAYTWYIYDKKHDTFKTYNKFMIQVFPIFVAQMKNKINTL